MADVKYCIREFTPTQNQVGMSHTFYAQAVVDNVITNRELARKIEARGLSRAAEIKAILEEAANIILEEVAENNRVQIESGEGVLVSIYPKCEGSVSDAYVQAHAGDFGGKSAAEEEMLTADRLQWRIGASVGRKFSKRFALNKTAQKVDYNPAQTTAEPSDSDEPTVTPGGGDDPNGGND